MDLENEATPATVGNEAPVTKFIGQINNVIYFVNMARNYRKEYRSWKMGRNSYSIAVASSDRFFFDVQKWLFTQLDVSKQRNLLLVSREKRSTGTDYSEFLARVFDSDSDSAQMVNVDGHRIRVTMQKPMKGADLLKAELSGSPTGPSVDTPRLVFTSYSAEANAALLRLMDELKEEANRRQRNPRLNLLSSWYNDTNSELPSRPIESVVLAEGQIERITADMDRFLKSEEEYMRRGIPWHRGYLFHGSPGTGKSSLAKALACHFGLDLYYCPIGSITSDLELTKMVAKVAEKSILLLEDVDVFKGFKDRDNNKDNFSLSGFLNILDGVMTPHGMITIMTTNHKDVLDPAVLRPGRVDVDEELGLMVGDHADRLFTVFYGQEPNRPLGVEDIAPSVIMEIMKSHLHDPWRAEQEIRALRGKKIEAPHKPNLGDVLVALAAEEEVR